MARKNTCMCFHAALITTLLILLTATIAMANYNTQLPADHSQVNTWFNNNVKPYTARHGTLLSTLATAEASQKVIKVNKDGSGQFKTSTSIPVGNTKRVIVYIGGVYNEKITIPQNKPFVTFYGSPTTMPILTFAVTAQKYGTVDSATLIAESDYFVAAITLLLRWEKSGRTGVGIEGVGGKSLYLNIELHVLGNNEMTVITAQARDSASEDTGYSFVHCNITETGNGTYLGRVWRTSPRVVFAYTSMSEVITPVGWNNKNRLEHDSTVFYGEYKCSSPGSNMVGRVKYTKQLTGEQIKPFLSLGYIQGSKWLLPPPNPKL
ncbi:hypothetical protein L3X38_014630 [Prunus dulcis]|uniref:pectinesterase n=1 Tax=Prunus dulcis TaxID=3755 RepID=A0AAD4WP66_PRUDU|nr:hypothetical protein L3X38_014630 [Prunus dulcis]